MSKNETDGMSFEQFREAVQNKKLTAPAYELLFNRNGDFTVEPVKIESLPLEVQLIFAYYRICSDPRIQAVLRLLEEQEPQAKCASCTEYDRCTDPDKQPR